MGQKVNPNVLRLGYIRSWDSKWFAKGKEFTKFLHRDIEIRKLLEKKLKEAGVSHIEILRSGTNVNVIVHTGKPGIIIGKGGEAVEVLKKELEKKTGEKFTITIREIKKPNLNAKLAAELIAQQIEKRISYRRAAKMTIDKALEGGALGAKVFVSGRLNGVEISRSEFFSKGKVPLHTLRADIDYAFVPAFTSYGTIGVKVWIYRGLLFKKRNTGSEELISVSTEAKTA